MDLIGSKRNASSDSTHSVAVLLAWTFHCTNSLRQRVITGFAAVSVHLHTAGQNTTSRRVACRGVLVGCLPEKDIVLHTDWF